MVDPLSPLAGPAARLVLVALLLALMWSGVAWVLLT